MDPFYESIVPHLEFTMEFQSNQLIYQKEYTKRQQIIIFLSIIFMIEKGGVIERYQIGWTRVE